jgi:hypothetical protein
MRFKKGEAMEDGGRYRAGRVGMKGWQRGASAWLNLRMQSIQQTYCKTGLKRNAFNWSCPRKLLALRLYEKRVLACFLLKGSEIGVS